MDNNASIESLSIEIEGTAKDSVSSVQDLIKTLNSLQTSLDNTINSSKNFKALKTNLSSVSSEVSKMQKTLSGNNSTSGKSGIGSSFGYSVKSLLALAGINKSWSSLTKYFEEASAYQESMNLYMVTMNENAQKGLKWIREYSNALYLDPSNVMQYMGAFNSLTKGLGVGADNSYLMSKNLTQLTYDLASFKNLDIESAFKKIQSGISGELEPLRNVGIALSQATLQELAFSLGIEKNVANMTESEKAQLRYIQLMKQSTEWQTDMAKTLMSPANATRIIRQQFTLLARAIGNVLIPIIMTVIPYVMVLTQWLTKLASKLAKVVEKLFGIKLDFNYDREITGLSGIADGIGDIGDAAGKSAKKLNTMLAPFDDLNVVQNQLDKNGSGVGDLLGGGDLGVALPEYDALAGLTDKFRANMSKAEKNLKKILPIVKLIGIAFAAWKLKGPVSSVLGLFGVGKTSGSITSTTKILPSWKNLLKGMAELAVLISGVVLFVEALGLLTRIPGFKKNITEGIAALVEVFVGVGKILLPLAGLTTLTTVLGMLGGTGAKSIAIGLADLAIVIGGLEILITAIGLFTKIPGVERAIDTGLQSVSKVFNNLSELALPLLGFTVAIGLLGLTGGAGAGSIAVGLLLFAEVIVGLQAVVAAIGALQQIPGFTWLIGEGGKALVQLGDILGSFVGSIVSSFTSKLSSILPQAGKDLSSFANNAAPFFNTMGNVNSTVIDGIKGLATALLILTAKNVIDGLTSWFAGKASLTAFGKDLAQFAPYFAKYADAVSNLDADIVNKSANAALALTAVVDNLPRQGGSISKVIGNKNLKEFGKMLPDFGKNLKAYSDNISGINSAVVTESANAGKAVAEMAKNLPNKGGLLAKLVGDNSLKDFGKMLPDFGKNLKAYSDNVHGISSDVVNKSTKCAKAISELAENLPNQDGAISWFTGDNKLSTFGKEMYAFSNYFIKYYQNIAGISTGTMNNVTNSIKRLVDVLKDIKNNKLNTILINFGEALSVAKFQISSFFSNAFPTWEASQIGWNFGWSLGTSIKTAMKQSIGSTLKVHNNKNNSTLASYKIKAYDTGGYPSSGDLFFANENGVPEMVGRIGNKTAVANQDQITTSITNAVVQGLAQSGANTSKSSKTVIYIGNSKVYEGYGDYAESENDRYGTNVIRI